MTAAADWVSGRENVAMDDLVTWLTGALDHIERWARLAMTDEPWSAGQPDDDLGWVYRMGDYGWTVRGADIETEDSEHGKALVRHIALHDPRAVLAQVEADRALLRCYESGDLDHLALADVLRFRAWAYRFHMPGWREAWAPVGVEAAG